MRLTAEQALELQQQTGIDLGVKSGKAATASKPSARRPKARKRGRNPQAELLAAMQMEWGDAVHSDYAGAIPGRKFELDMAFIPEKLGVEVDGWQYHGKFKSGFHRDREKRNLLLLNGWALLTFSAREVFADPMGCVEMVGQVLRQRRADQQQ